ncbi:MAG: GIY-YIG nuclease family protein [Proteobacteria bacterium]|nr:GIY-YIG nuclease family protein [Pseudomonadota bacterium]
MRQPCVYIMASKRNGTLYTGVTSNLAGRAYQHREGLIAGFTKRYGCKLLVWYELLETMPDAIAREKQIKAGSRSDKIALIVIARSETTKQSIFTSRCKMDCRVGLSASSQ